jgi:DNA-binding NarL/FixJ family response regulator
MPNPKTYNILIVDDHPMIINAYNNAIQSHFKGDSTFLFNIISTTSIDETIEIIENNSAQERIDLVLLDISMPKSKMTKMRSGEDLGIYIKSKLPNVKIIALTALNDPVRLLTL